MSEWLQQMERERRIRQREGKLLGAWLVLCGLLFAALAYRACEQEMRLPPCPYACREVRP